MARFLAGAPGLRLEDHPEVYPPSDDTFLILEAIRRPKGSVLEVGTGSGIIAAACARTAEWVVATDQNPHAVRLARQNIARNGLEAEVVAADLFDGISGRFDMVVFNPPYLPTSPEDVTGDRWLDLSVNGGPDGLGPARRFLAGVEAHLSPGGRALTLVSSLSAGRLRAPGGLSLRPVGSRKLPFETLTVLEARRAGGRPTGGRAP